MIGFQLVVQHRAAGVLTSTNFNLDALVYYRRSQEVKILADHYLVASGSVTPDQVRSGLAYLLYQFS
jgi:hypothetical protein